MRIKQYFFLLIMFFCAVSVALYMQSCSNDDDHTPADKFEKIINSQEYSEFISNLDLYQKKTIAAINSMNLSERNKFFENTNNDTYMLHFLEKFNLTDDNINLKKAASKLSQNVNFVKLSDKEKSDLFIFGGSNSSDKNSPRVKDGSEGKTPCDQEFDRQFAILNSITTIKIIACTCMVEVPIAACLCYTAVMAEFYSSLDSLMRQRDICNNNLNRRY